MLDYRATTINPLLFFSWLPIVYLPPWYNPYLIHWVVCSNDVWMKGEQRITVTVKCTWIDLKAAGWPLPLSHSQCALLHSVWFESLCVWSSLTDAGACSSLSVRMSHVSRGEAGLWWWLGGWEAECRQLAWQPAALAACWSRVECAGRKRNAT